MPRTAGSQLNQHMAARFERVCGHKGYSYDSFNAISKPSSADSISRHNFGFSRIRVPTNIMDEIGYEDCDWISSEIDGGFWHRFQSWPFPLELHVPCRDPVDHLLSICNLIGLGYDCGKGVDSQLSKCLLHNSRFPSTNAGFNMRCFNYKKVDQYLDYMAQHLDTKRSPHGVASREHPRSTTKECLWDDSRAEEREEVRLKMIQKYSYYRFCSECMGTHKEIPLK